MCASDGSSNSFCCDFLKALNWAKEGKRQGYNTMIIMQEERGQRYPIYMNIKEGDNVFSTCKNVFSTCKGDRLIKTITLKKQGII